MRTNIKKREHNPIFENAGVLPMDIPIDSQPVILSPMLEKGMEIAEVTIES